jgi:hypothetical protein
MLTDAADVPILCVSSASLGRNVCTDATSASLGRNSYHAGSDSVLILDVARFKYPPHWLPLSQLWKSMLRHDPTTGEPRGFVGNRSPTSNPHATRNRTSNRPASPTFSSLPNHLTTTFQPPSNHLTTTSQPPHNHGPLRADRHWQRCLMGAQTRFSRLCKVVSAECRLGMWRLLSFFGCRSWFQREASLTRTINLSNTCEVCWAPLEADVKPSGMTAPCGNARHTTSIAFALCVSPITLRCSRFVHCLLAPADSLFSGFMRFRGIISFFYLSISMNT